MGPAQTIRLTTGARVIRGSRRVGLLLGALIVLAGAAIGFGEGSSSARYKVSAYEQAKCLSRKTAAGLLVSYYSGDTPHYLFKENGCPGMGYSATEAEIRATAAGPAPSFNAIMAGEVWPWLLASAAIAAAIFGMSWGIGWVLAGFTAD